MTEALLAGIAATTVAVAVPLILAGLGEVIVEKAGIINVGIEGMMLTGAFAAYIAAAHWQSAGAGLLAAAVAGMFLAGLFALLSLIFKADQVVVGTAINILALGLTGVLYRALQVNLPNLGYHAVFHPLPIFGLSHFPVLGSALFQQDIIGYAAFALVAVCAWFLLKTRYGLALRAAGEYPRAAETAGWSVPGVRLAALMFGGAMAGAAGAYLSIAYTSGFAQGMSGGKGFIALAVVIVGRWSPIGVMFGALLFGLASAMQYGFQASNTHVPYQFFLALPYVLTLVALIARSSRVLAPAALGQSFRRGSA